MMARTDARPSQLHLEETIEILAQNKTGIAVGFTEKMEGTRTAGFEVDVRQRRKLTMRTMCQVTTEKGRSAGPLELYAWNGKIQRHQRRRYV
jgi:hypothetical protein